MSKVKVNFKYNAQIWESSDKAKELFGLKELEAQTLNTEIYPFDFLAIGQSFCIVHPNSNTQIFANLKQNCTQRNKSKTISARFEVITHGDSKADDYIIEVVRVK